MVPISNRRRSSTSRFKLCANMEGIPGTREGRRKPTSSLRGFPSCTVELGCCANVLASAVEQNVLLIASVYPAARRVRRRKDSLGAQGSSVTLPVKDGSVLAKRLYPWRRAISSIKSISKARSRRQLGNVTA